MEVEVELDGLLFQLARIKESSLGWPRGYGHVTNRRR